MIEDIQEHREDLVPLIGIIGLGAEFDTLGFWQFNQRRDQERGLHEI